jgi:hypothetical protein
MWRKANLVIVTFLRIIRETMLMTGTGKRDNLLWWSHILLWRLRLFIVGFSQQDLFTLQCYNYLQLVGMDPPFTAVAAPTHSLTSRYTQQFCVTAYMHCRRNSDWRCVYCSLNTVPQHCPNSDFLSESKSKSHYSWRSVNQSVLMSSPFWGSWPDFTFS